MKRYTFANPQTLAVLPSGATRIYFDEKTAEEVITITDEKGKEQAVKQKVYTYRATDIPAGDPVDKGAIAQAIIRADYSQAEVEAIFRKRLAGAKTDGFDDFNKAAEDAVARAEKLTK